MTTHERPFGRNFEDFEVGDIYKHWPGKTITEYDDHLFCMITMNHHPLHTNAWYAQDTVQGKNVVVGRSARRSRARSHGWCRWPLRARAVDPTCGVAGC